ncbi:uncharacterized protein LOC132263813 [Phlebotomus argentipes]|uniref:uncharacterized protein LOC132263813 n=1 Tax=Phlebotomus argentipes TaxID=94469 RepID=UPI002893476E|nr:uncharacterized protein LOC132263813 [Phlebotomus argentipes]
MIQRTVCGFCEKTASSTVVPRSEHVKVFQYFKKNYKSTPTPSPVCHACYDRALNIYKNSLARRQATHTESSDTASRALNTSNTSSSFSSTSSPNQSSFEGIPDAQLASRASEKDSREERGVTLEANVGSQQPRTLPESLPDSQHGAVEIEDIPPFLPEPEAHEDANTESQSSGSPADLLAYTPDEDLQIEGPLPKRRRVVVNEEEVTEERQEVEAVPAAAEEVSEVVLETSAQLSSRSSSSSSDPVDIEQLMNADDEVVEITASEVNQEHNEPIRISTAAPSPRNPRMRDQSIQELLGRINTNRALVADLVNRGPGFVNNMPRNHAG